MEIKEILEKKIVRADEEDEEFVCPECKDTLYAGNMVGYITLRFNESTECPLYVCKNCDVVCIVL